VGHDVRVVGSGPAEGIALIVEVVAPGAQAMDAESALQGAQVVFLAVPLHKLETVDAQLLRGRIVVDVTNFWEPIDGPQPRFADTESGTSGVVASMFPGTRLVKSVNHVGYHEIETDARPAGAPDRRAMGVASDDAAAAATVMALVDAVGFDPVYVGSLERGRVLEAGGPVFGARMTKHQLLAALS
jgi:predicted dinucleotide-binding enzyme